MYRVLSVPVALLLWWLLPGCATVPSAPRPSSRLMVHITPTGPTVLADLGRGGVVVVTVNVGGIAGAAVSCSTIHIWINGHLLGTVEPDCAPEAVQWDGGLWSRSFGLSQGHYQIEVQAQEPGRRPVYAHRELEVL